MEVSVTLGESALLEVEDSVTLVGASWATICRIIPAVAIKGRFGEIGERERANLLFLPFSWEVF